MQGHLLRIHEVAEQFAVHPKTVSRWLRRGQMPFVRLPGGERRVRRADVEGVLCPSLREDAQS